MFIRVDWFTSHIDWGSWQEKMPQIQISVWQGVIKQRFLSLQLKWAVFSMNGTRELEDRILSPPAFILSIFSPVLPIPLCIKWYFSMYSSKIPSVVFIHTISATDFKETPISHCLPNFSIWTSFSCSPTLYKEQNLSDTTVTQRM